MRYELKSIDTKISFDILLLEGCKNDFLLLEGVRSVRCELRRRKYENFFDILLLGGCKNDFLLLGRSEECKI